jgi:hypothetical protein
MLRKDWRFGKRRGRLMLIVCCPICRSGPAQQILDEYKVTVKARTGSTLGGVCAYLCPGGHVFFVREADLGLAKATAA